MLHKNIGGYMKKVITAVLITFAMSFALQAQSARYIAKYGKDLDKKVIQTPEEIDNRVAEILLATKEITIDKLTPEQEKYISSWDF